MSTDNTNIAELESVAGDLTEIIEEASLAFQVCGVQYSSTPNPLLFGVRKKAGSKGFEVLSVTPNKYTTADSEGFSEEIIDDIFNLYGDNALNYFKKVQSNEIADALDTTLVAYMNSTAAAETAITIDVSSVTAMQDLIIKLNKTRMEIANATRRGFPSVVVASGGVCAMLLSHKMLSHDSGYAANKDRANIKFIGRLADADVYQDLNAASEYCLVTHKSGVPGDAGYILIPVSEPKFAVRRDQEAAGFTHHYKQRFAYGQNPLSEVVTPVAQVSTVTFTNFDVDDTIEIGGIGGTPAAVTCTTDETTTMDLVVAEITGRTGETVTATNVGGVLTLTANTPGTAFTPTATIVDLGLGAVSTRLIATPTANVAATPSIFTKKFDVTLTGYDAL